MDTIRLPYFDIQRAGIASPTNWGITKYLPENQRKREDGLGVTVAVMDTGILPHVEVADQIIEHLNFAGDRFTDQSSSHGTHVASTIAGKSANIGYAPAASLIDLRILNSDGTGDLSYVLEAGQWLLDNRSKYGDLWLNCSFGYSGRNDEIEKMFRDFKLADINVVGAAGNTGSEMLFYPGAFSNVTTVAAMDETEKIASFSTSNNQLDIAAPGTSIGGAWGRDGYAGLSGTSMAAPAVTGMGVIKASRLRKRKTIVDYIKVFRETATDIEGVGFDHKSGFGRITPVKILSYEIGEDDTEYQKEGNEMGFFIAISILILIIIGLSAF